MDSTAVLTREARDAALREDPWLRRFHPSPDARVTLVAFPHAGGSASYFHRLSALLAPDVELFAVQYPGRQDRRLEPSLDSVHALADGVLPSLALLPDRPLALLGHSLGASVAFETMRRLAAAGSEPHVLFASGRPGPRVHKSFDIHKLSDTAFLATIRRMNGTDTRLLDDPEVVAMVLPSLRTDYRAAETYRYVEGTPLSCSIVVLHGDADDFVPGYDVRDWALETTGDFNLHVFRGGHFYLADQWEAVAETLTHHLPA